MAAQYELSEPPTDVISAVRYAPKSDTRLLVSSWDRHIYLYETPSPNTSGEGHLELRVEHRAPVLDVCFGEDDDQAFSAGLDQDVSHVNLATGKKTVLSTHNDGVRNVVYSPQHHLLVSSSWDKTLHIHIIENAQLTHPFAAVAIPDKPYCLSVSPTKLVVAMANRSILVYDLQSLRLLTSQSAPSPENPDNTLSVEPLQHREPALKMMTRSLTCMADDSGFAISSIEGRVGVEFFNPAPEVQKGKYAFRCHRVTTEEEEVVYPVNALEFHPIKQKVFASGGGDAAVVLWDGEGKRRIRPLPALASSVAAMAWNATGGTLAIGTSPGFEDGSEEIDPGLVKVYIRAVGSNELVAKKK